MKLEIGHFVLRVRSLDVSVPFYCGVLGMRERRRSRTRRMAFLSFGARDHDIGLLEVGAPAHPRDEARAGLAHIAFRVGDSSADLRAFMEHLDGLGLAPRRTAKHDFSSSIYLEDPDGIELEVYVDAAER